MEIEKAVAELRNNSRYRTLLDIVESGRPDSYQLAVMRAKSMISGLLENEIHKAVQSIIITESEKVGFFQNLMNGVKTMWSKAVGAISSISGFDSLIKDAKRNLPKFEKLADEISRKNNIYPTKEDAKDILKKLEMELKTKSNNLPDSADKDISSRFSVSEGYTKEGYWSIVAFKVKWIELYIVYGLLWGFATGTGFVFLSAVHVPFLVMLLKDLLENLTSEKTMVPI